MTYINIKNYIKYIKKTIKEIENENNARVIGVRRVDGFAFKIMNKETKKESNIITLGGIL